MNKQRKRYTAEGKVTVLRRKELIAAAFAIQYEDVARICQVLCVMKQNRSHCVIGG